MSKLLKCSLPCSKLNVMPIFEISPLEARYSEWLVFEGRHLIYQQLMHVPLLLEIADAVLSLTCWGCQRRRAHAKLCYSTCWLRPTRRPCKYCRLLYLNTQRYATGLLKMIAYNALCRDLH